MTSPETGTNGNGHGAGANGSTPTDGADAGPAGWAARGLGDIAAVGELGLQAASSVVEQILSLSRQLTEARFPVAPLHGDPPTDAPGTAQPREDPRREMRRLRADAERLIELYGDWTRSLLDGVSSLAEREPPAGADVLLLGPVAAGSTATATVWLHVLEGPAAGPAPLHATDLVAHDRTVLPGSALTFDPPAVDTTASDQSSEIAVHLEVPLGTPAMVVHGWILAEGLDEVALPVRLEVTG